MLMAAILHTDQQHLVLQSPEVGARSTGAAWETRICSHTQGGMQRFDLENYRLVTAVPTKCTADSAYLSVYLMLSFSHCKCLSPWAGERPASCRDPRVSLFPH